MNLSDQSTCSVFIRDVILSACALILTACSATPQTEQFKPQLKRQQSISNTGAILRYDTVHHPVIASKGMVVSQNRLASEVGQQILKSGGNAVDAAVAVGFALAVTLPRAGNIGGSGFMLMHDAKEDSTVALDFRSAAPAKATLNDFIGADGEIDWEAMTFGPRAAAVPGTVAGLYQAWQRFGSRTWQELLAPAQRLADEGIIVSDDLAFALKEFEPTMRHYPSSAAVYLKGGGGSYKAGDRWRQPDLGRSIKSIAEQGADAFYKGEIAQKIAQFMTEQNGYITANDLDSYQVRERDLIETQFNGYRVVTMPPVSGGGIAILQLLNVLSEFSMDSYPAGSAKSLHIIAEAMKRVAANRRIGIGDPDYVSVPVDAMLSKAVAQQIAAEISLDRFRHVKDIQPMDVSPYPSTETTHYSVADRFGNAVSVTYTLGYSFGSGVVVPGTGILLDNQLRNFSHRQPGHANKLEAGKRMVSTMAPTLVFNEDNSLYMVTGSPGGSRIPNIVAQILINVLQYDMNIAEATNAPRIHQQWRTPELGYEQGLSLDTVRLLEQMGHSVGRQQTMGSTQSIMMKNGYYYGASDPRRPGAAALGID